MLALLHGKRAVDMSAPEHAQDGEPNWGANGETKGFVKYLAWLEVDELRNLEWYLGLDCVAVGCDSSLRLPLPGGEN